MIVTPDIYEEYKKKKEWKLGWAYFKFFLRKGRIEMWKKTNIQREPLICYIQRAEVIDGLPFLSLEDFIMWKKAMGRRKDLRDLKLLKVWLKTKSL